MLSNTDHSLMSSIEPLAAIDSERHCRGHGARVCHFPGHDSEPMEIGANAWVLPWVDRALLNRYDLDDVRSK